MQPMYVRFSHRHCSASPQQAFILRWLNMFIQCTIYTVSRNPTWGSSHSSQSCTEEATLQLQLHHEEAYTFSSPMNTSGCAFSSRHLRQDVVDADDAVWAGGAAVVDDGGVALHPHPAPVLGQEAVVLCGHLTLHQHYGRDRKWGTGGELMHQVCVDMDLFCLGPFLYWFALKNVAMSFPIIKND